jgi:double-stranded uracil-DNA glycosylase
MQTKARAAEDVTSGSFLLPDIIAKDLQVIFCGINPGMTAAISGHHFSSGSNRFWRVLHLAGFTPMQIRPEDDRTILKFGCGLTTAVARATRRADELSADEFVLARAALSRKIRRFAPLAVAFLGKAAYSAITRQPLVHWGQQASPFAGAAAWVVPNPSGLNRSFRTADLVKAYREMRLGVSASSSAIRS